MVNALGLNALGREAKIRRIARVALDAVNTLPEAHGRRVVRFLALLYLRPADCRKIERILTMGSNNT